MVIWIDTKAIWLSEDSHRKGVLAILRHFLQWFTLTQFVVQQAMNIQKMDDVTAFLNGHLGEEIYIEQPEGFIESGKEHLAACQLKRSLYALKQVIQCWNQELDEFLLSNSFIQSFAYPYIYVRDVEKNSITMLAVYVDDIVLFTKTEEKTVQEKDLLSTCFKIKGMGPLDDILGVRVEQKDGTLHLHQRSFIENLLEKFGMQQCMNMSLCCLQPSRLFGFIDFSTSLDFTAVNH